VALAETAKPVADDRTGVSESRPPVERVEERRDVPAETADSARLGHLRELSRLFDSSIPVPGTDYRIGLDPILGLLPVVGDVPGATVSAYIVAEAAGMGVPRATLARMLFNLVVDAVVGSVPVAGDLFDAVWKANQRNVALLEARVDDPTAGRADRRFLLVVTVGLLVLLLAVGTASVLALLWLAGQVGPLG
jgi:hypothetical protein